MNNNDPHTKLSAGVAPVSSSFYCQDIVDTISSYLLVLDNNCQVIFANNSFYRTFKTTPDRTLGQPIEPLFPLPGLSERIRELLRTGKAFSNLDCTITQPNGRKRLFSISVAKIQPTDEDTNQSNQQRLLLWADDITQLKQAEQELIRQASSAEKSSRLKTEFLANMSHEIRTPMNGIIGFADLLTMEDLSAQQAEWVNVIHNCGQNLLALIDDILDISRIEANELRIEPCQFGIADVLDDLCRTTAPSIEAEGLSFLLDLAQDTPGTMNSDPQRLRQILSNLLTNAKKFTHPGGSITLRTRSDLLDNAPAVRFEVIDTGIGIAPENHEAIFEVFKQADTSAARKYGGSGLGLAICKHLTHRLGGRICLQSQLSQGSTFVVVLPLQIPMSQSADQTELAQPPSDSTTKSEGILQLAGRILLAEDNEINRTLLRIVLERVGLQVDQAEDGRKALQLASSQQYDLVLMDIQMPNLDGVQATRSIRKKGITTPVIALTARAMVHEQQQYIQAGFDGALAKPINQGALLATVQQHLPTAAPATATP